MPEKPPRFRKRQFPMIGGRRRFEEKSSSQRGYDHAWEKLSSDFRRRNPFCRFCEQEGFEASLADDVDHIIPLEDGGKRLDRSNLQSLCRRHHNGLKRRLQEYARRTGQIDDLPNWCENPTNRPDMTRRR